MKPITKKYSNGEITILWQNEWCIHSTICWKKATGLPEVFNPSAHPWISAEGVATELLKQQVDKCPSNALSYTKNNQLKETLPQSIDIVNIIEVATNIPLLV